MGMLDNLMGRCNHLRELRLFLHGITTIKIVEKSLLSRQVLIEGNACPFNSSQDTLLSTTPICLVHFLQ
jgi:hypothetical protein